MDVNNCVGDVMFESRGGKEDLRLKKSFRRLMDHGTNFIESNELQKYYTSKELKIKPKVSNIAGLQLADLLAHPMRRWIFKNLLGLYDGKTTFSDKILSRVEEKIFQYDGKRLGYGIKKIP